MHGRGYDDPVQHDALWTVGNPWKKTGGVSITNRQRIAAAGRHYHVEECRRALNRVGHVYDNMGRTDRIRGGEIRREPGAQLFEAIETTKQCVFEVILSSARYGYPGDCAVAARSGRS